MITDDPECVVSIITDPRSANKDGEEDMTLAERQSSDVKLRPIIQYFREGILPNDEKFAKHLALNKKQYVLMDNVLYHNSKNHKVQNLCHLNLTNGRSKWHGNLLLYITKQTPMEIINSDTNTRR